MLFYLPSKENIQDILPQVYLVAKGYPEDKILLNKNNFFLSIVSISRQTHNSFGFLKVREF